MRIRRAALTLSALGLFVVQALAPAPALAKAPPGSKTPSAHAPAKGHDAAHAPAGGAAAGKPGKRSSKHPRKAGEPGEPDEATRRVIAGLGRTAHESPELRAMRELDRALFPAGAPSAGAPWIAEGTPLIDRGEPEVVASGMPPSSPLAAPAVESVRDLSWLRQLAMPDLPVRWDARVVRYLEFYKHNARGRSMVAGWVKKSGRYGGAVRRILRENNLPEDILWLALVESGFDPTIGSPAGAAGLWQFMPDGARIYGLTVDRWIDERLDPERSTLAAARYLADLHSRFGSWELAFAAYNMGYGGLLASIRKYNTNDFWELSRLEAGMPLETALYVPKIVAMAIVSRNRAAFGLDDVELDPAVSFDKIGVRPGVSMQSVALAAGTSTDKVAELNPQLTASRAPPALPGHDGDASWTVRVPPGTASRAALALPKFADAETKVERYVVRWGESIDDVAARRHTTRGMLASLNGVRHDESLRPGTVLLVPVPRAEGGMDDPFAEAPSGKPVVVVPAQSFAFADRRRIFYRVIPGDTLRDVASLFGVTPDEVCRWNAIDPAATLHDGMALQIYPPAGPTRSDVLALEERDARVLPVGSPEFFTHFEGLKGRTRLELTAKQGDTWRTVAHKYGLSVAQLERINGRARSTALNPGDKLVVYVANGKVPAAPGARPGHAPKPDPKAPPVDTAPDLVAVTKPSEAAPDARDVAELQSPVPVGDEAAMRDDTMVRPASVMVPIPVTASGPSGAAAAPAALPRTPLGASRR
jgi:membrane-bound lytic murein transglycosylase D